MRKNLTLLVTLLLCMGLIAPAWGAQALSVQKQTLIDKFKVDALDLQTQLSQTSTGSADYTVEQLNGGLLLMAPELANIQGSKLSVDYKLNTPNEKIGFKWNLTYKGKDYHGDVYIVGSKIIFTKDILQLIREVVPTAEVPDPTGLPQYLYLDEPEMSNLWATTMLNSKFPKVLPQLNGLFAFIIEAIPDKYIQLSGNNIQIQLSQKEFEDVIHSVLKKVAAEPDRFATLVAELMTTVNPSQLREVQKDEILAVLQQAIANGEFPPKASEMEQFFREAGIQLESLFLVTPKSVEGDSSLSVKLTVKDQEKSLGKITFNMDQTRQGEQVNGKLNALLNLNIEEQNANVVVEVAGDYGQSQNSARSDMRLNVTASNQQMPMLGLVINTSSRATVDSQVRVDIPTLNKDNSLDLNTILKEEEPEIQQKSIAIFPGMEQQVSVVLNGRPVVFDVQPFIKNGRTMVPVRNLAEALGCRVNLLNDHEIMIVKGNKYLMMKIGERRYTVNGLAKGLDVPAYTKGGRTLVPLRFVAEELGCDVKVKGDTVILTSH